MWTPDQYAPITGSGARKLATSAVAPLVAAARGYLSVTPTTLKESASALGLATNSKHYRQLRTAVGATDTLVLPWFDGADVTQAAASSVVTGQQVRPTPASLQLRPDVPRFDANGRPVKYELLAGNLSVLGIHPATPPSWISSPSRVLIAEGALKGDSALTAYLRHIGVSEDDLSIADPVQAWSRLNEILSMTPAEQTVLIVTFVGAANWHSDPSWNALRFHGLEVNICFDADVAQNPNVWREADRLWQLIERKKGRPGLVALPDIGIPKMGIDDWFAGPGSWPDLIAAVLTEMPDRPSVADEPAAGEWRVIPEKHIVAKYSPAIGPDGRPVPGAGSWEPKVDIAGRVKGIDYIREAYADELESGILDPRPDPSAVEAGVEFELTYLVDGEIEPRVTVVAGTATTAADPPDQWHRRGAALSPALTTHPDWPPPIDWLRAIKRHRRSDVLERTRWGHMGWVPTETAGMVFIAGNCVVGADGLLTHDVAQPGVTDLLLAGASNYGVQVAASPEDDQLAFETVITAYLDAWRNPADAAVILAAAIRPVAPFYPRRTLFITGTAGSGKTWAARAAMNFWQSRPGAFQTASTGAVNDTFAATEVAVSRTPIWVMDDLAPKASRTASEADQTKVGEIFRAVANATPRRRQRPDMTSRAPSTPRAMLIATGENTLPIASEMQRVVHVHAQKNGYLASSREATDLVESLARTTMMPSTVTGACIRYIGQRGAAIGWAAMVREYTEAMAGLKTRAQRVIQGGFDSVRHAESIADLALGLTILIETGVWLGVDRRLIRRLQGLFAGMYAIAASGVRGSTETRAGISAIKAIAAALAAGECHITGPDLGMPVGAGTTLLDLGDLALNRRLGWVPPSRPDDAPRPGGKRIGDLVTGPSGSLVVILQPDAAFTVAARSTGLVNPGQRSGQTWSAVWEEGLAATEWQRKRSGANTPSSNVRACGVTGVPVPLSTLIQVSNGEWGLTDDDSQLDDLPR